MRNEKLLVLYVDLFCCLIFCIEFNVFVFMRIITNVYDIVYIHR